MGAGAKRAGREVREGGTEREKRSDGAGRKESREGNEEEQRGSVHLSSA